MALYHPRCFGLLRGGKMAASDGALPSFLFVKTGWVTIDSTAPAGRVCHAEPGDAGTDNLYPTK